MTLRRYKRYPKYKDAGVECGVRRQPKGDAAERA